MLHTTQTASWCCVQLLLVVKGRTHIIKAAILQHNDAPLYINGVDWKCQANIWQVWNKKSALRIQRNGPSECYVFMLYYWIIVTHSLTLSVPGNSSSFVLLSFVSLSKSLNRFKYGCAALLFLQNNQEYLPNTPCMFIYAYILYMHESLCSLWGARGENKRWGVSLTKRFVYMPHLNT